MKKIIFSVIVLVIAGVMTLLVRLGAFEDVGLKLAEAGPFFILYQNHIGAYHKIVSVIENVESWSQKHGLHCERSFGQYFDDPEKNEEDRLKSRGGCLIDLTREKLGNFPAEFKTENLPKQLYLIASFSGAPSIGPYKVYPKAKKWIAEHSYELVGAVIEIYVIKSKQEVDTDYYFPVRSTGEAGVGLESRSAGAASMISPVTGK